MDNDAGISTYLNKYIHTCTYLWKIYNNRNKCDTYIAPLSKILPYSKFRGEWMYVASPLPKSWGGDISPHPPSIYAHVLAYQIWGFQSNCGFQLSVTPNWFTMTMTHCLYQNFDEYDFASLFVINTTIKIARRRAGESIMQVRRLKCVSGERKRSQRKPAQT